MTHDSRPRDQYRLPSGELVDLIADHGDLIATSKTFETRSGTVVRATLVSVGKCSCGLCPSQR